MSEKASEENRAILIAKYGLDQPVYVQYGKYLQNLLHGDMGTSYVLQKGRCSAGDYFLNPLLCLWGLESGH